MVFRYLDEAQTWHQEPRPAAWMPQAHMTETGMSNYMRPRLSESRYYSLPAKELDARRPQPHRLSHPQRSHLTIIFQ